MRSFVCLHELSQDFRILFITRPLSFKNLPFKRNMRTCSISFDSHAWTQKSDITWASYEHFDLLISSCVCLHEFSHIFGIFFIYRPLSVKILTFKFHIIASSISLDSQVWTQQSDITQATYEHFDLLIHSCLFLHELPHNFGIFFITCPLSFKILTFKFHMITCTISFDSHVWAQKSDIIRATNDHFVLLMRSCVCLHELSHNFGILFITHPLNFKILTFKFHTIACFILFVSHVWTQKADITWATYEHFDLLMRCYVCLHEL